MGKREKKFSHQVNIFFYYFYFLLLLTYAAVLFNVFINMLVYYVRNQAGIKLSKFEL